MSGLFLRHARLRSSIRGSALCLAGYRSSMSFLCAVKVKERTDVASRTGETRSCFHRSLLFQPSDTSPKNSTKNYRIIFNSDVQFPYLAVHFYELLSSRLYVERFVSLSPLEHRELLEEQ